MATNDIKERCSRCKGTGIDADIFDAQGNPVPESCTICNGDGWITQAKTESDPALADILDKVNDNKEKLDEIWNKLNE